MSDFADYCCELLGSLGPCQARRMFGGHGLSLEGINIGLIINERLYLKVDEQSRPAFEAAGCDAFTYSRKDGPVVALGYWSAPSEAMDSPRLMAPWARLALEAALRARNRKKPVARPRKPAADVPAAGRIAAGAAVLAKPTAAKPSARKASSRQAAAGKAATGKAATGKAATGKAATGKAAAGVKTQRKA